MSRVVVLGGTGFVGPFIVSQLVGRGDDVTLFHRGQREPLLTEGAEHVHGAFEQLPEHVGKLVRRRPDVVIDVNPGVGKRGHGVLHFAGVAGRGIVLTSMDVYRAMSVLWSGSSPAADELQPMPVSEESELRDHPSRDLTPDIDFDNLAVERAVGDSGHGFQVTVLRCPVIYGPLDTQRRLKHYVRRMVDGRQAVVLDARLARLRMSRGYVENIAQAVVAAVSSDHAAGRTYNVAEVEPLSEAEWAGEIAAVLGWGGDIVAVDPGKLPADLQVPLPPQDLYADSSRVRRELGYVEAVSRPEGLRRAVEWEIAQQRGEPSPDYASEDAALRRLRDASP